MVANAPWPLIALETPSAVLMIVSVSSTPLWSYKKSLVRPARVPLVTLISRQPPPMLAMWNPGASLSPGLAGRLKTIVPSISHFTREPSYSKP